MGAALLLPFSAALAALSCGETESINGIDAGVGVGVDAGADSMSDADAAPPRYTGEKVIVIVWSGMPSSLVGDRTPNLTALAARGVRFQDHHAVLPSTTITSAASLATGQYPGHHRVWGTTIYEPGTSGARGDGSFLDGSRPLSLDDDGTIDAVAAKRGGRLTKSTTLFERAQASGVRTLSVGEAGAAYLQDPLRGGMVLDEQRVWPLDLAQSLLEKDVLLPVSAPLAYPPGTIKLPSGKPPYTVNPVIQLLGVAVSDPKISQNRPPAEGAIRYFSSLLLEHLLPERAPDLTVVWLPSPDDADRALGPGTTASLTAVALLDQLLGDLEAYLADHGLQDSTNIIVTSDHGASSVSGDPALFPFRGLDRSDSVSFPQPSGEGGSYFPATVSDPAVDGYPVSGDVRAADLLYSAGWAAYDGPSQIASPVMSGILGGGPYATAPRVYPAPGISSINPVPENPPAGSVVVASNGGAELFHVIGQDPGQIAQIVAALQSRQEFGAIFVADEHRSLPGVVPFSSIGMASTNALDGSSPGPDILATYRWDEAVTVSGFAGIEYSSMLNRRGTSGGSSPGDIHGVLVAAGPSFKVGATLDQPSSVVDLAPTIARILKIDFPGADGRVLTEALVDGAEGELPGAAESQVLEPESPASNITRYQPTSPFSTAANTDPTDHEFAFVVRSKKVTQSGVEHIYVDSAGPLSR